MPSSVLSSIKPTSSTNTKVYGRNHKLATVSTCTLAFLSRCRCACARRPVGVAMGDPLHVLLCCPLAQSSCHGRFAGAGRTAHDVGLMHHVHRLQRRLQLVKVLPLPAIQRHSRGILHHADGRLKVNDGTPGPQGEDEVDHPLGAVRAFRLQPAAGWQSLSPTTLVPDVWQVRTSGVRAPRQRGSRSEPFGWIHSPVIHCPKKASSNLDPKCMMRATRPPFRRL